MFWLSIVAQERERDLFDRLADRCRACRGVLAEGLLDERLRPVEAAAVGGGAGVRLGELQDDLLLLVGGDRLELGDLDRDHLDLLGRRGAAGCRPLPLREAW